jgi:hypothetical protein
MHLAPVTRNATLHACPDCFPLRTGPADARSVRPDPQRTRMEESMNSGPPPGHPFRSRPWLVGILIAKPGVTTIGGLSVELLPGRTYALFCNFQDGPDKPPHSSLGMVSSRTIP